MRYDLLKKDTVESRMSRTLDFSNLPITRPKEYSSQSNTAILPLISRTTLFFTPIFLFLEGPKNWDSIVCKLTGRFFFTTGMLWKLILTWIMTG